MQCVILFVFFRLRQGGRRSLFGGSPAGRRRRPVPRPLRRQAARLCRHGDGGGWRQLPGEGDANLAAAGGRFDETLMGILISCVGRQSSARSRAPPQNHPGGLCFVLSVCMQLGFLKAQHRYEIAFTLPEVPALGKDVCLAPTPSPHLRVVDVSPAPGGKQARDAFHAQTTWFELWALWPQRD